MEGGLSPNLSLVLPTESNIVLLPSTPPVLDGLTTDDLLGCTPGDFPPTEVAQKAADAMLEATRVDQ
jgi:hypothetical protein